MGSTVLSKKPNAGELGGQVQRQEARVQLSVRMAQPKKLYRMQVGAFEVKANAERLRDELKGKGYPGFIQEVDV